MNDSIDDEAAISFSIGFYQALGAGRNIEEAFKFGLAQMAMSGPDEDVPVLLKAVNQ